MSQVSTTSRFGETGCRGFAGSGRSDRERTFQSALRHSRRVRMLRIAIPVGAAIVLLVLVLAIWLNPLRLIAKLPKEIRQSGHLGHQDHHGAAAHVGLYARLAGL